MSCQNTKSYQDTELSSTTMTESTQLEFEYSHNHKVFQFKGLVWKDNNCKVFKVLNGDESPKEKLHQICSLNDWQVPSYTKVSRLIYQDKGLKYVARVKVMNSQFSSTPMLKWSQCMQNAALKAIDAYKTHAVKLI